MSDTNQIDKLLLRPTEAAEALGVSRAFVYQRAASGELPSVRIGKAVRIPADALKNWIAEHIMEVSKR